MRKTSIFSKEKRWRIDCIEEENLKNGREMEREGEEERERERDIEKDQERKKVEYSARDGWMER